MPVQRRLAIMLAVCSLAGLACWMVASLPAPPPADAATAAAVVTIAGESFEGPFPPDHWTASGHWGKSACHASVGAFSAWVEGSAPMASCNPADTIYHPNESARLAFGPFDLSDAVTATLSFDLMLWQTAGDTFSWGASTDGINFTGITVTNAYSPTWQPKLLDLAAVPSFGDLRGQPQVWIAFSWQTDGFAETFDGALVDNVRITKGVKAEDPVTLTPSETASETPGVTPSATAPISTYLHLPLVVRPPLTTPAPTSTSAPTAAPTAAPTSEPTSEPSSTPAVTPLPPALAGYSLGDDYADTGSDCALIGAKDAPVVYPAGTKQIAFRLVFDVNQFHGSYKTSFTGNFGGAVTGTACSKYAIVSGSPRLAQVAAVTKRTDGKPLAPGSYTFVVTINSSQALEVPFTIQ